MTELKATECTFRVTLPNVVSWSRPRRDRGGVRYPPAYIRNRGAWATVVAHSVFCQQWSQPSTARYRVKVTVHGGGKRDLDRVCTAVLDALQAGNAVPDDCLVDALTAIRLPVQRGERPSTRVEVVSFSGNSTPRRHVTKSRPSPGGARQMEVRHAR